MLLWNSGGKRGKRESRKDKIVQESQKAEQCSAVQGGAGECTGGQDLCKKSVLVWGEVGKGERHVKEKKD